MTSNRSGSPCSHTMEVTNELLQCDAPHSIAMYFTHKQINNIFMIDAGCTWQEARSKDAPWGPTVNRCWWWYAPLGQSSDLLQQDLPASATLAFMEFVWMTSTGKESQAVTCCLHVQVGRVCSPLSSILKKEIRDFHRISKKNDSVRLRMRVTKGSSTERIGPTWMNVSTTNKRGV